MRLIYHKAASVRQKREGASVWDRRAFLMGYW